MLMALAEATVLPHWQVGGAQPDLTLLVVGAWSLRRGVEEGAIWAFFGGVGLDLLSGGPHAAAIFGLLAVSLILGIDPSTGIGRTQTRPFGGNPLALIASVGLSTLVFHLTLLAGLRLSARPVNWAAAGAGVIAPRVLFNLILIPFVYRALGWLDRRTRGEQYAL